MANIFVSYKYADSDVYPIRNKGRKTTVRDYVDELEDKFKASGQVYRGEQGDEDLSDYSDDYIKEHLKTKIFYTSVTVVLISPTMKERNRYDKSQWIPWEVYYSLRRTTRSDRQSQRNAIIAVVLPDYLGSYDYAIVDKNCCSKGCSLWKTDTFFTIIQRNMFNKKDKESVACSIGDDVYRGIHSYINLVKWEDFIKNINSYITWAEEVKNAFTDDELYINVNKE